MPLELELEHIAELEVFRNSGSGSPAFRMYASKSIITGAKASVNAAKNA